MKKQAEDLFRKKCQFVVSFRYELFFSLNALLDPNSRIHPGWRKRTRLVLGREFAKLSAELGGAWEIWPVLPSLLPGALSNPSFDEIRVSLARLPMENFKEKILRGLLHAEEAVRPLLKGRASLAAALSKTPKAKREWLSHIGVYPYDENSPQIIALEFLVKRPERFRELVLRILEIYWNNAFKETWERLVPQLRASLEARERLFHSCSLAEFSQQALLRIEVDEARGEIGAIRGGYRLRLADVEACHFLPSAFNDRRFWSAFREDAGKTTVYFPYFDASIALDARSSHGSSDFVEPELDPALIFKALGDSTRFAMAALLARRPMSSVELAKALSVSKPTISHHVHLLREAGLLKESYNQGAVELQLKRSVLEELSSLAVAKLFESEKPLPLVRTRGGALPN